jgi:hypothetical protein
MMEIALVVLALALAMAIFAVVRLAYGLGDAGDRLEEAIRRALSAEERADGYIERLLSMRKLGYAEIDGEPQSYAITREMEREIARERRRIAEAEGDRGAAWIDG